MSCLYLLNKCILIRDGHISIYVLYGTVGHRIPAHRESTNAVQKCLLMFMTDSINADKWPERERVAHHCSDVSQLLRKIEEREGKLLQWPFFKCNCSARHGCSETGLLNQGRTRLVLNLQLSPLSVCPNNWLALFVLHWYHCCHHQHVQLLLPERSAFKTQYRP